MSGIIWIASYPKSGNTWCRIFLTNLAIGGEEPADINRLGYPVASSRKFLDDVLGVESSDLPASEVDALRPAAYDVLASQYENTLFMKLHDAFHARSTGTPIIPKASTRGIIYIVRNPLDVAVSMQNHMGGGIDAMVDAMGSEDYALSKKERAITNQLPQQLYSWSTHVRSWIDGAKDMPLLSVRYEDMLLQPEETFGEIARFTGVSEDPMRIRRAIAFSDFRELKRQENEQGFRERSSKASSFFRKGGVGGWRAVLSEEHVQALVAGHREVMLRLGYLDAEGQPVF